MKKTTQHATALALSAHQLIKLPTTLSEADKWEGLLQSAQRDEQPNVEPSSERLPEINTTRRNKPVFPEIGEVNPQMQRAAKQPTLKRGQSGVSFGPFRWIVLEVWNQAALLLTEDIVEQRVYNIDDGKRRIWETSSMREYLKHEFLAQFSDAEQEIMLPTDTVYPEGGKMYYENDSDYLDKIFLLDIAQVENYCKSELFHIPISENSASDMMERSEIFRLVEGALWWTRPLRYWRAFLSAVDRTGQSCCYDSGWGLGIGGLRPALWVNLNRF